MNKPQLHIDQYAVIGHPVAHSLSPEIHTAFAAQTSQDMDYRRLLAPLDGFIETVQQFRQHGGRGLNVTVPFKLEAFALAAQQNTQGLTPRALQAGAVNTLRFDDAQIIGDNTDGVGLMRAIGQLGIEFRDARVLLLGSGGAARGVIGPLLAGHPASLTLANRSIEKAEALAALFADRAIKPQASRFNALVAQTFDVIINATSASLDSARLKVPDSIFRDAALAYDLMYGAAPTVFLQQAAAQGAHACADGLGMLVEQAAEAFYLWRGVRPDTAPVYAQLRKLLTLRG